MQGLEGAAELLAQRAGRPLHPVEFHLIAGATEAPRCLAVDGSSAILVDNGAAWVVALRAVAVAWPGPAQPEPEPRVVATLPSDAQATVDSAYARAGLEGPAVRSADAFAEALRGLAELEATLAAVAHASPGTLLLVDGALHGLPPTAAALAGRVVEAARARGLPVAGVAKRSGIEGSGLPLVPALLAEAKARGIAGPWAVVAEPGVHVAKLHRAAQHAFRIDADADVLPLLAALSNDAAYTGYPYPLALAHNRVALTGAHVRDLKARLDLELRRKGAAAAGLARDFHAVLDANVPG
ncbi:MAG TPA: DNA double-strand break repair nuclease NurA [Candidatus Thermoplasmatota archaeon]|nr:DNA double-strand break repair nuclease NurA [Candidatus Thermoplasmatota archaeon]